MVRRSILQISEPMSYDGSMTQDFKAIASSSRQLGVHMYEAVVGSLPGTILQWVALVAAVYLFILDRTNWRTNILTALLVPYIALQMPPSLLSYIRSEIGYWVAFILVVLRLFFPRHFPEEAELPGALILLLITAPRTLVNLRFSIWSDIVCLLIGFYLLYEHILQAGGVRKAFAERGVPMTIGILCLFIAPLWEIISYLI